MKTKSGADLRQLLETLRNEMQPVDGHPDPGAIEDCWREVFETLFPTPTKTSEVIREIKEALEREDDDFQVTGRKLREWLRSLLDQLAEKEAEIERLSECTPDKPCYEHLKMSRDGWQEIAEEAKAENERLRAELEDERHQHEFEKRSHDMAREQLSQAREALEWIRDAGADMWSIIKARDAIHAIRGGGAK